jgi:hypothetical protein
MTRGRLRVYLGAAPGVGKTYAMLGEAHRRYGRGTDVVIGFVECHGRARTLELLDGLEAVPRKTMGYRGTTFTELDTDALIARASQVALARLPGAYGDGPGVGPPAGQGAGGGEGEDATPPVLTHEGREGHLALLLRAGGGIRLRQHRHDWDEQPRGRQGQQHRMLARGRAGPRGKGGRDFSIGAAIVTLGTTDAGGARGGHVNRHYPHMATA